MFKKIIVMMMALALLMIGVVSAEEIVEETPVFAYVGGFYYYEDEASEEVYSNGTAAMMYAEPDVESEKIVLLPKNSKVRIIEKDVMFYKVEYTLVKDVYIGWIENRYIVDKPTYCYEKAIITVPKGLYLREEPSKKAKAIILMPNETEIVVIYYMNGWARVDAYIDNVVYSGYAYINNHIAPRPIPTDDVCDDSAGDPIM